MKEGYNAGTVIHFQDVERHGIYDVMDGSGRWCEGKVLKISQEKQAVYVTYLYWDDRFDEWVSDVEARIAPLHTHTYITGGALKVGQRVEALDESQKWLECFVIDVDQDRAKIHYKGYHAKFDEWIDLQHVPSRIRPYGRDKAIPGKVLREGGGPKRWRLPRSEAQRSGAGSASVEPGRRRSEGKDFSVVKSPGVMKTGQDTGKSDEPVMLFGSSGANNNQENERPDSSSGKREEADERTRRITNLSEQFRTYSDALAKQNLSVVSVEGDGNCLFRAVAHQVYGNESYHMVVRAKCLDYMEVEADFFSQFVEGGKEFFPLYLRAKRMDACWGDDPEIEALCELYDRRAEIWAFDPVAGAQKLRTFHETSVGNAHIAPHNTTSAGALSAASGTVSPPRSATGQRSAQSPRREDLTPVIRLSYYGGGHYDSIVAPYHAETLLKRLPGETEEQQIVRTQQRRRVHSSTADRERAQVLQSATSADATTSFAAESIELAQKASDSEATEQAALEAALQESRRNYLNSDYRDLESCLLLSMQQYAQETGQSSAAAHIPMSKEGIEVFQDKLDMGAKADATENLVSVQDTLLHSVQEQSERDYYESAILSSMRSEGKFDDSALTEEELIALVAAESASEAARSEQRLLDDALRESAGLPIMTGPATTSSGVQQRAEVERSADMTMESQPKASAGDDNNGVYQNSRPGSSSSSYKMTPGSAQGPHPPTRDAGDVIHLSDLKEDAALELALRQSLQQAQYGGGSGAGAKDKSYAPPEFQTEDEMLHFALEASLQGYTSADYADYKETHASSSGGDHGSTAVGSHTGGGGYVVNLGAQYGGTSAGGANYSNYGGDAEDMDEDLMRAIAESLRK